MEIKLRGDVKGFQTDKKTGLLVPNTYFEDHNTIDSNLHEYLAYKITTNTNNYSLDNLFTTHRVPIIGDSNMDGICHCTVGDGTGINYVFDTDLNAGGDNATSYIEYYAHGEGALTLTGYLLLIYDLTEWDSTKVTAIYASYDINTSVLVGRVFHFYWKITLVGS